MSLPSEGSDCPGPPANSYGLWQARSGTTPCLEDSPFTQLIHHIDVTATSRIFQRILPTPTMTSVERLRPILPGWDNYHIFLVLWEEELCSL